MKYLIYLFAVAFMVACSSGNSSMEKVISTYKQTDPKTGKFYDLKFKMIEMGEPVAITVADSTRFLEEEFRKENAQSIENYNNLISMARKNLENEKKNSRPSPSMIEIHEKDIEKYGEKIAEIESYKPDLGKYASMNENDVLVYSIVCSYTMNDLSGNNISEESEFILSPDKATVYKATRIMK